MKVIITSDEGEVLDSQDLTREEFDNLTGVGAFALLREMSVGDAS